MIWPSTSPNHPGRHGPEHWEVVRADSPPKRPGGHAVQLPLADVLYLPMGQGIPSWDVDCRGHWKPAGQGPEHWGVVRPPMAPNTPGGHAVHTPAPPVLKNPAGHRDAVAEVDPPGHEYPGEHSPLQEDVSAPGAPHVPAGHGAVQAPSTRPGVAPYRPAAHGEHRPAPPALHWPATHWVARGLVDPAGQA